MRILQRRPTILLLLAVLVFAVYGRILSVPIWNQADIGILHDAWLLSADPLILFRYLGNIFSQPLLQLGFLGGFRLFGTDPAGYLALNLLIHALNCFLVFQLSMLLFPRFGMSLLASILFAFSVGHYGKILMSISGLEPLVTASLYLTVLICLIRNDLHNEGRIGSPLYLISLALLAVAGLTSTASLSMLGCLLAYKFFFYKERGRRGIFSADLMLLVLVGAVFYVAQGIWGWEESSIGRAQPRTTLNFTWISLKNIFRYLNLLIFPMQQSSLVQSGHPLIQLVYEWRTPIRVMVSLMIIAFGFFGIVFGSRPIRFFLAWTVITVLPFALASADRGWLNLQSLYVSAVGFCIILASGTSAGCSLLSHHRRRRLVPLLIPLFMVLVAQTVAVRLDGQNRRNALRPEMVEIRERLEAEILAPADRNDADRPG